MIRQLTVYYDSRILCKNLDLVQVYGSSGQICNNNQKHERTLRRNSFVILKLYSKSCNFKVKLTWIYTSSRVVQKMYVCACTHTHPLCAIAHQCIHEYSEASFRHREKEYYDPLLIVIIGEGVMGDRCWYYVYVIRGFYFLFNWDSIGNALIQYL